MADTNTKKITGAIEEESLIEILLRYVYVIIKYKLVVLITAAIIMPVMYIYLRAKEPEFKPKYRAEAKIRVMAGGITEGKQDLKRTMYEEDQQIKRKVDDLYNLMRSTTVLKNAIEKTGALESGEDILAYTKTLRDPKAGTLSVERELNYIYLSIVGEDPQQITTLLNAIIESTREELLNSKRLVAKEALESLEKQLKEVRSDLEQAKLKLTKFIVENEVLSEAIEIKEGKGQLTQDVDKLALQLVDIRSQRAQSQDFIKEIKNIQESTGDIEAFKQIMHRNEKLVDTNLLKNLSEQETVLNELLLVNKEAHPDVLKAQDRLIQIKESISQGINSAIEALNRENETLKAREQKLTNLIEKGLSEAMIEYSQLQRNVSIKEGLSQKVVDSIQELSLASKLIDAGTFSVIDSPTEPKAPFNLYEKTRAVTNYLLFSIIFGLGAGIGLAILIDYFGMAIKDIQEIESALDYPILGEIPAYGESAKEEKHTLPLEDDPRSVISEAFKALRTNIKFRCAGRDIKTLLVTSLVPSEGKTFICANLAVAFAQTDEKILVVDCDLRKSTLHKYYKLENKKGLSQLVQGESNVTPSATKIANLSVLVAGRHPPNPAELLVSDNFDKVLESLKKEYDLIIIDSPPLFAVTDPTILIKKSDLALLTVRANVTPKKAVRRAARLDKDIKSKILGLVFNSIDTARGRYGSYYYYKYDYYGKKEKDEKKV